jgi:hypothetical protein
MVVFLLIGFLSGIIAFISQLLLFLRMDHKKKLSFLDAFIFATYRIFKALFINELKSDKLYKVILMIFRISFWSFILFLILSAFIV